MTGGAGTPPRVLGTADATWLVVSSIIGAGIFLTPSEVARHLPHAGWLLAAWGFGAVLAFAGAVANAELGAMYPEAGGDYVFLARAFHPSAGFAVGVLTFAAVFGGSVASLAIGFAESLTAGLGLRSSLQIPLACVVIVLVTVLNGASTTLAARFGTVSAVVKVALILLLVTAPFWAPTVVGEHPASVAIHSDAPRVTARGFLLALPAVLFSYAGWNATTYVASELKNPARTLPRSLLLGLGGCVAIYLAVNVAAIGALSARGLGDTPVFAVALARSAFPAWAPKVVAVSMAVCMASCLQANALVGSRIAFAMAKGGHLPGRLAALGGAGDVPRAAVAAQGLVALVLVLTMRTFPRVLDHATFAILLATVADVAALIWLRHTRPDLSRPYRAPLFPWLPLAYAAANLAIAASMLLAQPGACAAALLELALAFGVYFALRR